MSDSDATQRMPSSELIDNRYRLGRSLGRGGVAEVFEALDTKLERRVAIKLFRGDAADELQRHESEMRTLAQLDHPALVTVYDAGRDGSRPWLVMQLIEGTTVAAEIARRGRIAPEQVARWGATVAAGLAYVHGQGVIHRDIKPANLLLSPDNRVHLADFGIARLVDTAHLTRADEIVGTPAYFAPEQVAGEGVGPAADIYALGLVLLECLTAVRAYEGTAWEVAVARLSRDPDIPADLPPAWRSLLRGTFVRTPGQRPLAAELSERLRLLSGDDTGSLLIPQASTSSVLRPLVPPAEPMPTQFLPQTFALGADPAPTTRLGQPTSRADEPESRRGQRAGIAIAIVLLLILVVIGTVAVINRGDQGSGQAWTRGSPPIKQARVEKAMERLEQAVASS